MFILKSFLKQNFASESEVCIFQIDVLVSSPDPRTLTVLLNAVEGGSIHGKEWEGNGQKDQEQAGHFIFFLRG